MTTKLTLTMEEDVIARAKEYAKMQGSSLSGLVETYLKSVTSKEKIGNKTLVTPIAKSLRGIAKLPDDFDYKTVLTEELYKKYMK